MGCRILALGAGAMGAKAAETLSGFSEVERLTLADLSREAAERAARACVCPTRAERVDVTDRAGLAALMRGHDVIINCVGPFFRFGVPILETAIEAGVDYLDICDDPAPTRDMLAMDEKARLAGVTAVIGMGASPGVNNLLGACVHQRLDQTDELLAAWNIEEKTGEGGVIAYSAAIVHWLEQCSGTVLECRDGALVETAPLCDVPVDYPGRGKRTLYTVGHPEPVSFHVSWPRVKRTSCAMVMPSAWIGTFRKYQKIIDSGEKTLDQAAHDFATEISKASWLDALLTSLSRLTDGPRLPFFFVIGKGTKDGRKKTVAASVRAIASDMAGATGIPLALGTLMHLRNPGARKGVMAPETAFRPEPFFELLAPYCDTPAPVSAGDLVEIVED